MSYKVLACVRMIIRDDFKLVSIEYPLFVSVQNTSIKFVHTPSITGAAICTNTFAKVFPVLYFELIIIRSIIKKCDAPL